MLVQAPFKSIHLPEVVPASVEVGLPQSCSPHDVGGMLRQPPRGMVSPCVHRCTIGLDLQVGKLFNDLPQDVKMVPDTDLNTYCDLGFEALKCIHLGTKASDGHLRCVDMYLWRCINMPIY